MTFFLIYEKVFKHLLSPLKKKNQINHFRQKIFKITSSALPANIISEHGWNLCTTRQQVQVIKSKIYIKLEGVKFRFPLTWFKCTMARSYAVCTDLRTLGFLPSMRRSLSTVSSIPSGSSLLRGSHCLQKPTFSNSPWQLWFFFPQIIIFSQCVLSCLSGSYQVLLVSKKSTKKSFSPSSVSLHSPSLSTSTGGTGMGMPLWRSPSWGMSGSTICNNTGCQLQLTELSFPPRAWN